jgi:HlyD family secretion protein
VPESYADDLAISMTADVRSGGEVYSATIVSVSPEIIDNQVTCRLRFAGSPPERLRQNQRMNTRLILDEQRDVLQVSRGQFLDSSGGRLAYRVIDNLAYKTRIETGARSLNAVEIISGLDEGDVIIVSSTEILQDADVVLITQ